MSTKYSRYRSNELVEEFVRREREESREAALAYLKRNIAAYLSSEANRAYREGRREGIRISEQFLSR